jgi:CRP/FNR family transcriptional regulator
MHDTADFTAVHESSVREMLANPALGATRRTVPAGTVLCEPDTTADNLFFVESGQVRVYQVGQNDNGRLIEILGSDDWFGVSALARRATYGTRAVAVAPTVVWEVAAQDLLNFLPTQPMAAIELVKQLATKHVAAVDGASELVFDDCNSRLVKTLVRFSTSAAATPIGDDSVVLRITHEQLAQAVGAARETISLALTQLRQQNLLRTGRNQLFFSPKTLKDFAATLQPQATKATT